MFAKMFGSLKKNFPTLPKKFFLKNISMFWIFRKSMLESWRDWQKNYFLSATKIAACIHLLSLWSFSHVSGYDLRVDTIFQLQRQQTEVAWKDDWMKLFEKVLPDYIVDRTFYSDIFMFIPWNKNDVRLHLYMWN